MHATLKSMLNARLWIILILLAYFPNGAHARVLAGSTVKHLFSNPKSEDTFRLTLSGNTLRTSSATFDIYNAAGKRIYHEVFKAYWLLNSLDEHMTPKQVDQYMHKRVREFFNAKNFTTPAIGPTSQFDGDYVDRKEWESIRGDKTAVGFSFLLDYEYNRTIAWSKKLGRVVKVEACC